MLLQKYFARGVGAALLLACVSAARAEELSLHKAETMALQDDPGYTSLVQQSKAIANEATADGQLPDPMLSIGWLNLPVEDFNLTSEPMSQVRVGIKQVFPAGKTLSLRKDTDIAQARNVRKQAAGRQLTALLETRRAWLELQYADDALSILRRNQALFHQLRQITGSLYRTGKKSLNDVVRAELELQRLKDREVALEAGIGTRRAELARWIGTTASQATIPGQLPDWQLDPHKRAGLAARLMHHPLVAAMDAKVTQMRARVALAEEQRKPTWSVDLGYAFRNARRPNGDQVSNLVSLGASINLPVFAHNRQDKRVAAASTQLNAVLDDRRDLLRKLDARLEKALVTIDKLDQRIALHQNLIIPQAKEQAKAALMAYEANRTDFAEVMRAHIAELNGLLALRHLRTQRLEAIAAAWYLIPPHRDITRLNAVQPTSGEEHEQ